MVLGDRLYAVTVQRVFDKLRTREKILMVFMLLWEVVTMSFSKVTKIHTYSLFGLVIIIIVIINTL